MQRNKKNYAITAADAATLKARILNWLRQFNILAFFDNNNYPSLHSSYECLAAAGALQTITGNEGNLLETLQQAHATKQDWLFGHICYEYKDLLEPKLSSQHPVIHSFPLLHFVVPETVCYINAAQNEFTIETTLEADHVYHGIINTPSEIDTHVLPKLSFTRSTEDKDYIDVIDKLRQHIADGDCYEINYCISGTAHSKALDTLATFHALNKLSPSPFAAYYRLHHNYMMCASPERYIRKQGMHIISQPIKGTARRDADKTKDHDIKMALAADVKERAENIMIVDLVRNDLARCCETGSVQVDELFGIYSFPQVHQMISTVSGVLKAGTGTTHTLRNSFPMGSMTGAPKHKVMQLIEQYETSRRELFSGTVGYITPSGNFDFNVVIRSLFYNSLSGVLSWSAGGAITYDSVPQKEWDEMRLKASALERIFM